MNQQDKIVLFATTIFFGVLTYATHKANKQFDPDPTFIVNNLQRALEAAPATHTKESVYERLKDIPFPEKETSLIEVEEKSSNEFIPSESELKNPKGFKFTPSYMEWILKECNSITNTKQTFQEAPGYVVYTYQGVDEKGGIHAALCIEKDNSLVYAKSSMGIFKVERIPVRTVSSAFNYNIYPGEDITKDGISNLMVKEWSGGVSCCTNYYFFELGEEFKAAHTIHNWRYYDESPLADADEDLGIELVHSIGFLPYPNCSMSAILPAKIFLKKVGDSFQPIKSGITPIPIAPYATVTTDNDIKAIADKLRSETKVYEKTFKREVFSIMANLICAGHAKMAHRYFHYAWPLKVSGKEDFLNYFKEQIEKSNYWPDIQRINDMKVWYPLDPKLFY